MSVAVIVLGAALALCVFLIFNLNGNAERLENLVIEAANDIAENGRVSDMTGAQILSAARKISE